MPRRVASVNEAVEYGRNKCGGRFSRHILYRLLKRKKITAYRHSTRNVLVDLDSIDRYVKALPIVDYDND